jgi:hypothetical protein
MLCAHLHPIQEERFKVMQGTMRFRRGLRTITARAGDTVVVPPGTVHRFENAGNTPARMRVEVRPALRMEELFETTVALAREGRTTASGLPNPLELALFMREFNVEVRAPFAPAAAVRAVMGVAGVAGPGTEARFPLPEAGPPCAPFEV